MRNLLMAVFLAAAPAVVYGIDDIVLPLHDGRLVLKDIHFIEKSYSDTVPVLSFVLVNQTSSSWRFIRLKFEMSGFCSDNSTHWTEEIGLPLPWRADGRFEKPFRKLIIPLVGKVDG